LRLLAHALDIGPGDEVVTVSHTFVATLSPFVLRGATPVLVDIGDDHLMDPDALLSAVTERTKVIVPVHLNGRTVDMDVVGKAAAGVGAHVVEDAAQALGAQFRGRRTGTFGVASTYSFYPAKMLGALGDGGAVLTNESGLATRLLALRDHGRIDKTAMDGWGYNARLDNLQAAVLDWRLGRLPDWTERRREVARRYTAAIAGVGDLRLPVGPDQDDDRYDVYQNYAVTTESRDRLAEFLRDAGIETMVSWPVPMHHQPGLGLDHFRLPRTERLCREVLSLPMHAELDYWQVDYVAEQVRRFFGDG
jgi:dTDP-4-amino-4,6-dideoxygalactose transaminase